MDKCKAQFSKKQIAFKDMVLGILIYAVVLGFFNDYSAILATDSYSITFLLAVVMQILTYLALRLKIKVASKFRGRPEARYKIGLVLGVWAIMFFSKFIFLWVIAWVFPESVQISGFIGLTVIILIMATARWLFEFLFQKLAAD